MYALRFKTREHGWGKAEAFPDYDAAVLAIPRNPYPLQYMIARYHPVTPFEPGVVPRCITLIVDSGNWESVTKPEDFWNPAPSEHARIQRGRAA